MNEIDVATLNSNLYFVDVLKKILDFREKNLYQISALVYL